MFQIHEPSFNDSLQEYVLNHSARYGGPALPRGDWSLEELTALVVSAKTFLDTKFGTGSAARVETAWRKGPTWAVGIKFASVDTY